MKKVLSAISFVILVAISGSSTCFSQKFISRFRRSLDVLEVLEEKNIQAQKNELVPEYGGDFPFNISVEIPPFETEGHIDSGTSIDEVIFSFTQDFFMKNPEFIISFIENTKQNKLPYGCTVLLSADDEKAVLETNDENPVPSEHYAESLYETASSCAFIITDKDYFPPMILTAGKGHVSPMWIVRSVHKAFQANQKKMNVQYNLLYSLKNSLFKENARLSAFKKNGITSTSFPLGHESPDLEVLNALETEIINSRKQGGNTIYNVFGTKNLFIWINESVLTLIYLVFVAIALFTVCFSSFAYNAKNEAVFKDLSRTWFLLPAYLFLSASLLYSFHLIFFKTIKNPELYFYLKTMLSLSVAFCISALQNFYRFRTSIAAITFQILILCATNIAVFTFMDLSLIFCFMIEYLIVLAAGKSNGRTASVVALFLMAVPFIQPAASLYQNVNSDRIPELFGTSFSANLLFSMLLVPLTFQWMRCLILFNFKGKSNSEKNGRFLFFGIMISFISASALFLSFILSVSVTTKKNSEKNHQNMISVSDGNESEVSIESSSISDIDLITHRIEISPCNGKKILRCRVTLNAISTPLYECNFNYTMKSPTEASIEIPDGADGPISLVFSSDRDVEISAKMDFYMIKDELNAIHESRNFELMGKDHGRKAI